MIEMIIIAVCLLLSAFFSASETAYTTLSHTRLRVMKENGRRGAGLALKLSENYDSLLSTILVGNNIVNIALASVSTILFVRLIGNAGASVSTAVVTVAVLVFGEVTPKSIAKDYPEKFAVFAAPALSVLTVILKPVNFLFKMWKKLIGKLFGSKESKSMTQEELLIVLEEVEKEGAIGKSEGELLVNALEFGDSTAEEILTHRTEMEAVGIDWEKERIAEVFARSGLSRLPVYREDLDHIVGILHHKDFFTPQGVSKKDIQELMKPPVFANAGEKIDNVLRLMKKHKTHLCIVVDEYGGTSGLVTMEDILEELVGEIWDEHDEEKQEISDAGDNKFIVDGLANLDEFSEKTGLSIESDNVSVGGWVMEMLGRIPEPGDSFEYENAKVEVLSTDGHRVASVAVAIL
ncbi:MAG: HlyC/CorC family transporter [Clostridia bacterium]|nr:HlyC/CorC family transporter [Clostridia bacterium]